jgi:hypothetical protein
VFDWSVVEREASRPVGGRLLYFSHNWEQITNDPWVRNTVAGLKLRFTSTPPPSAPRGPPHFDLDTARLLTAEIHDLESKVAISRVPAGSDAGFVSPMFVVPKSDRTWRPVINLKALNNYISCPHFKMESIRTAKDLIRQGD